jgi:hypothetical protein
MLCNNNLRYLSPDQPTPALATLPSNRALSVESTISSRPPIGRDSTLFDVVRRRRRYPIKQLEAPLGVAIRPYAYPRWNHYD